MKITTQQLRLIIKEELEKQTQSVKDPNTGKSYGITVGISDPVSRSIHLSFGSAFSITLAKKDAERLIQEVQSVLAGVPDEDDEDRRRHDLLSYYENRYEEEVHGRSPPADDYDLFIGPPEKRLSIEELEKFVNEFDEPVVPGSKKSSQRTSFSEDILSSIRKKLESKSEPTGRRLSESHARITEEEMRAWLSGDWGFVSEENE